MTDTGIKPADGYDKLLAKRKRSSKIFAVVCAVSTWSALAILIVLLVSVVMQTHPVSYTHLTLPTKRIV